MQPTHSHLAWHETLELHELVAAQSNALMKFKIAYPKIKDPILKTIYKQTIDTLTQNIMELLQFYPLTPKTGRDDDASRDETSAAAAGELLGFANHLSKITQWRLRKQPPLPFERYLRNI